VRLEKEYLWLLPLITGENNMSNKDDILDLFNSAVKDDNFDSNASMILVDNLDTVAMAGCMGTDLDQLNSDDVTLVAVVLDQSSSMYGSAQPVILGYNAMLDALRDSRQADSILISTWKFSDKSELLFSYTPVTQLGNLTHHDYTPNGSTALYDTLADVMTGLVAYGQHLRNNGVRTRCVVVAFSDGEDNLSRVGAYDIRTVSQALLAQEIYSLAYVGFGGSDLRQIASAIGFPSIITASTTPGEIRRIFHQVSQSVIRASQMTVGAGNNFFI
jgi:uncharacterized protein YegL